MLPHRIVSTAEAEAHYQRVISRSRPLSLTEFDQGWIVQEILSPQEIAEGRAFGMGHAIVDRETGTVTGHGSLPPAMSARLHTEARAKGEFAGGVEWPWSATSAKTWVRAQRQESNRRPLVVTDLAEDQWMVTPERMPDEAHPPEVSYAVDGQTMTIWEYPGATATVYPDQKERGQITARQIYPIPSAHT